MQKRYNYNKCICGTEKKKSSKTCNKCRLEKLSLEALNILEKKCTKCKIIKPRNAFYIKKNNRPNSKCINCVAIYSHERYLKNPALFNANSIKWQKEHPKEFKIINRRSKQKNKHKVPLQFQNWYYQNHEEILSKKKEKRKLPEKRARSKFDCANRRARKKQATPSWVDKQHKSLIKEFYKNCPEGYQVDHIIPIKGKNVTGFHVISNLQYLTKFDNISKKNKYEGEIISY